MCIGDTKDGFLNVKLEPSGTIISLPFMTRVEFIKTENGRDYFKIIENVYKGKIASVKRPSVSKSHLSDKCRYTGGICCTFTIMEDKLKVPGVGEFHAVTSLEEPIKEGCYPILLPKFPHKRADRYIGESKYRRAWFKLGGTKDFFLHVGMRSLGCVTVYAYSPNNAGTWDRIYKKLMSHRRNDKEVGTLKVIRSSSSKKTKEKDCCPQR